MPELDATGVVQALADGDMPLLVDYVADRCIWCARIEPLLVAAQTKYLNRLRIVKVNIGLHPQALPADGIRATPTLAFYRAGTLVMSRSGMMQRGSLEAFIEHWLNPVNEGLSGI